jgi:hypothetical protein
LHLMLLNFWEFHENRRREYRNRRKWKYIYAYTVKPYTYFQSRTKERLGEVCVLSHGVAFQIVLQDGAVLRNVILLTWLLHLR